MLETGAGTRIVDVEDAGSIRFDYTVCRIGETDQLKMVIYAVQPGQLNGSLFLERCNRWIETQIGQPKNAR